MDHHQSSTLWLLRWRLESFGWREGKSTRQTRRSHSTFNRQIQSLEKIEFGLDVFLYLIEKYEGADDPWSWILNRQLPLIFIHTFYFSPPLFIFYIFSLHGLLNLFLFTNTNSITAGDKIGPVEMLSFFFSEGVVMWGSVAKLPYVDMVGAVN